MTVEIRPYAESDFVGVEALWREAFPDEPPQNAAALAIPAKLAMQPDLLLVAAEELQIVESINAGYDGHRGWLYNVAVLQSHRRRGIGAALVRDAEKRLAALGCPKINLQVRTTNEVVVGFYWRLGYAIEERISMGKRL
ncbi:MAG: GNAT family acetyltransferase [Alphaproteobacteria bacterium]|nr:GNAT family acetyltransferase [Alphaproteobacteria bacterium]